MNSPANEELGETKGISAGRDGDETAAPGRIHRMPFGAEIVEGGVRFRLFAPNAETVDLRLEDGAGQQRMEATGGGWHELTTGGANGGSRYKFVLPDGTAVPDPVSRYQPDDVTGPSEVIDAAAFPWKDADWKGRPWSEAVLYELHVGTFTPQGTFRAAIGKLDHLRDLGITAIELMCVADFAGLRNWGYDGVLLYAPDSAYGRPEDMKAFVDAAHARGLMVILDVVYNHFGPEGNYLHLYFPQVLTNAHHTPWGQAVNFDTDCSMEVRDLIVHNALYWVEEFHVDGLRLDATHAMMDESSKHILDELADRVHALVTDRPVALIMESDSNAAARLQRDEAGHAKRYVAQWNHDITHLLGAAMGGACDEDQGGPHPETAKLGQALAEGFVISVEESGDTKTSHSVPPQAFVAFLQTHDLVGNRVFGERVGMLAPEWAVRAVSAVYLLLPQIPMLFMGEEWSASTPFLFFCDYHGELADAVRKGRCEQLAHMIPAPSEEEFARAPDPQADETFLASQLKWEELEEEAHADSLDWHRRILAVRRDRVVPLLRGLRQSCGTHRVVGQGAFTINWELGEGRELVLAANLCQHPTHGFPDVRGQIIWEENGGGGEEMRAWGVRWELLQIDGS